MSTGANNHDLLHCAGNFLRVLTSLPSCHGAERYSPGTQWLFWRSREMQGWPYDLNWQVLSLPTLQ